MSLSALKRSTHDGRASLVKPSPRSSLKMSGLLEGLNGEEVDWFIIIRSLSLCCVSNKIIHRTTARSSSHPSHSFVCLRRTVVKLQLTRHSLYTIIGVSDFRYNRLMAYSLATSYAGHSLINGFNFESISDPTLGFVS